LHPTSPPGCRQGRHSSAQESRADVCAEINHLEKGPLRSGALVRGLQVSLPRFGAPRIRTGPKAAGGLQRHACPRQLHSQLLLLLRLSRRAENVKIHIRIVLRKMKTISISGLDNCILQWLTIKIAGAQARGRGRLKGRGRRHRY